MDYQLWLRMGLVKNPRVINKYLSAFRFSKETKTGSGFEDSLIEANALSREFSKRIGKGWIGKINYWLYYKRTALIYRLLS